MLDQPQMRIRKTVQISPRSKRELQGQTCRVKTGAKGRQNVVVVEHILALLRCICIFDLNTTVLLHLGLFVESKEL